MGVPDLIGVLEIESVRVGLFRGALSLPSFGPSPPDPLRGKVNLISPETILWISVLVCNCFAVKMKDQKRIDLILGEWNHNDQT